MAKGTKVRVKGNSQRRIRQREQDSDESDEEYMVDEEYRVGEDEECDDSDEYCSLDGDETDEILADFGKVKFKTETIGRTRNTRRNSPSRRGNTIKKLRKRRMISYTESDEEESLSDFGKVEFKTEADGRAQNTHRISSSRSGNTMKKLRERRVVSYTEDEEEEEEEEEGDAKVMALDKKAYEIERPREKKRVSYAELDDDDDEDEEDHTESMPLGRKGNRRKKPREKKRVSYAELDDDDEDEEDHTESMPLCRKGNRGKKPREKKRVSYAELDDDDEDEEDHTESMSLGRKGNRRKKPRERRRAYIKEEEDEDDGEFMFLGERENQKKVLRAKRRVSYTEEDDEDDSEFMSSSTDENQIKKSRVKRNVSYKEEDENEAEFVLSESDSLSRDGNKIRMSREKRRVSYKEEENEDENDTEFMLSESDFDDDEDEGPKMKKSEKVNRYHLQRRSTTRGQKKSRNSKILKKPRRSKSRNRRFNRKVGSFKERSVTNKNQVVEKQSKKISRRRKRRVTADSDSDFVSPASSDHQYTISEEEREQMKEARVYCANLRAKLRNSSSGRHEEEPMCEQRKQPVRKGKEKVEDTKKELGKQVCGICLSEEGKRTVRGVLNCCRHYFCFSCIMEWSKVESRCPLCKQRFATITKSAKPDSGFDLRAVVIRVPECDQVYQPSEEELRGYLDPYASVVCTECHHGGEDALMLLCDICDSPAHTFCVGLGREVPEDNWYCEGCRPTVFGSLSSQRPTPTSDRRLSSNALELSSPITGGFDLNELYVPDTPLTEETHVLPESRLPGGDFVPAPAGTVATTLRDRRRIHRHMHRRFLNDSIARSGGTSASSSGIRLFGSQLDETRDSSSQEALAFERSAHPHTSIEGREDDVMPSTRDTNLYSPRANQFAVQVQNSSLASLDVSFQAEIGRSGTTFDSRLGYAQLHPCTNRPSVRTDASPSPYACREAIGPSH